MFPAISRSLAASGLSRAVAAIFLFALIFGVTGIVRADDDDEKPKNLKVLDTTISHDDLINLMDQFTVALGVKCGFCHARTEGPNGRDWDWASDKMPAKLTARDMLRLTNAINGDYLAKMNDLDTPRVRVECVTCHRGQSVPVLIQDLLKRAYTSGGFMALDSVYRDLRGHYYGSHTFDFGDPMLVHLAMELSEESDSTALQILALNREFNQKSAFNEWATGQIYLELKDTVEAVTSLEKAVAIDSTYYRAIRSLDMLRGRMKR